MKYERIKQLLKDDFKKLEDAKILLLGVGGVGAHCLDCLIRSGVKDITIVDYDTYDKTNQNRQLWSELHEGELKTKALKKHYADIKVINVKVEEPWVKEFDFSQYDVVLDAIDNTRAKLALAQACYKKLISSFGSAKRLDPTKVQVADIWKSAGDPLGKKIRRELKRRKFKSKYMVIFSSEEAVVSEGKGSFIGVTATFGLTMCAEAIKKIRKGSINVKS
ncbi:MAG: tRNA cyclic N6-threonylcarbamoyladenosine(37) synthase TcdA [Sulfurimonas sp.]|nr:MAG: tRNA cyclic N6-threonylcarbamoyladenosine(37) synthase TcdA [Sulfurimonas sp.]